MNHFLNYYKDHKDEVFNYFDDLHHGNDVSNYFRSIVVDDIKNNIIFTLNDLFKFCDNFNLSLNELFLKLDFINKYQFYDQFKKLKSDGFINSLNDSLLKCFEINNISELVENCRNFENFEDEIRNMNVLKFFKDIYNKFDYDFNKDQSNYSKTILKTTVVIIVRIMDIIFKNEININPEQKNDSIKQNDQIEKKNDTDYYRVFNKEVIDIIKYSLTKEEYIGFLKGNIIKYSLRAGFKTDDTELDLKKRNDYLKWLLNEVK